METGGDNPIFSAQACQFPRSQTGVSSLHHVNCPADDLEALCWQIEFSLFGSSSVNRCISDSGGQGGCGPTTRSHDDRRPNEEATRVGVDRVWELAQFRLGADN